MTRTDASIAPPRRASRKRSASGALLSCLVLLAAAGTALAQKPKIAVFSGPTATIQNNAPLVTSNKAREQYGLPLLKDDSGRVLTDWPRYQRLATPVTVYVEMFTAHPLEADVKELYAPPDGYVNAKGVFSKEPTSPHDKPVYAVTLKPEDGLYALPYMGRQANGQAWESTATQAGRAVRRGAADLRARCLAHLRRDRAQWRRRVCARRLRLLSCRPRGRLHERPAGREAHRRRRRRHSRRSSSARISSPTVPTLPRNRARCSRAP